MPVFTYPPGTRESEIIEALRSVVDPEIGLNLVELGLIHTIRAEEDKVHIKMILTTPFCPYGPALLDQVRRKTQEVAGLPATVELGMELWDPTMMEEGAGREWGLF